MTDTVSVSNGPKRVPSPSKSWITTETPCYRLGDNHGSRTHTPLRSTLVAGAVVLLLALLLPLLSLAKLTSAMVLLVFILVNLALLRIKRLGPPPVGVRALPLWVPVLGALASAGVLVAGAIW